ncbi:MAG: PAS domain S-box protein [Pseudobdellovibrio sp.]|nr:PAS domain S-box protein [Pseudobdellovibrio sp.]
MENQDALDAAKRLKKSKKEVLSRWEYIVRSEFTEAQKETKPHLMDSLPKFLDQVIQALMRTDGRGEDIEKIEEVSEEHAVDRATTTRFTIEHIIREYEILRKVIFEFLEQEKPLGIPARDTILNAIQAGQSKATSQFSNITVEQERNFRKQLEEKEQVFKTIFELAAAGKAIVDVSSGRFLQVNRRFCEMLGYTPDELLKKTTEEITHPDDSNLVINKIPEDISLISEGKVWSIEKRYLQKDGTPLWVLISGALYPAIADQPARVIATVFDITEKKQIENLKDQFINTLSHDLRTPLSVIDMSAQLLRLKSQDAAMVLKLADRILDNSKRCDSMIQDLLDTSRIRAGHVMWLHIEHCDLISIVQEAIDELSSLHGDRFIFNGPASVKVYWSKKGIRRIIENLCSNAIKYGAKNFPVLISVDEVDSTINLSVKNHGEPIPKENMSSLFQQFSRTRSAESSGTLGWGIGLTIVKGFTEAHCGEIKVHSTEHDGTIFTVSLPRDARPCQENRINQLKKN